LQGNNLILAPNAQTNTHLSGRITSKKGGELDTIGKLFSAYLAGENQTLIAKGDFVQPSGSSKQVGWLSDAFKTLELSIVLPGQKFDVRMSKL
jgi:hypothetical protein